METILEMVYRMTLKDRVLIISGQYAGRKGTIVGLDEVFGIDVHVDHPMNEGCIYPRFLPEQLKVIE